MSALRAVLTIGGVELRRFLRDRSNLFFVFVFPLMLVLLIGAQFGDAGIAGRVVVTGSDSQLRADLVRAMSEEDLEVSSAGRPAALEQVARARADVAVLLDAGAASAYASGEGVDLRVVPSAQLGSRTAVQQVQLALQRLGEERGQVDALRDAGLGADAAETSLQATRASVEPPVLEVERVDELAEEFEGLGRFDFGASGQLLLFVFVSSLAGSTTLIQARRLGVVARTLAAPVSSRAVVVGQALGRVAIAMFQGGYIMAATAWLFDVNWGQLWLSLLVLALFALVAGGAAMLVGASVDNEGAASGVGVGLGLVLAALGGSMMPLELFPDTMARIAHVTPHAWAYDAFADIQRRDAGVLEVLPELGVLAAMAAAVLLAGGWALRRSLARAA